MQKASVVRERHFLPYLPFIESAKHFCDQLDQQGEVSWYDLMAATTLLALSVEALVNTIGELIVPNFSDFESCSPKAKIRILYENAGENFVKDRPPVNDVLKLLKTRNDLAHPKFKVLRYESEKMELSEARRNYLEQGELLHEIEKAATPENCKRWLRSLLEMQQLLEVHLDPQVRGIRSHKKLVIHDPNPEP